MAVYLGTINEATTGQYTATLYDETGVVIDGTGLTTLTLTLYDVATGVVINSRNAQNVNQTNGVTITSAGVLTWTVSYADTAIVGTKKIERHAAVFVGTWAAGTKKFTHEVQMDVVNLSKVGSA